MTELLQTMGNMQMSTCLFPGLLTPSLTCLNSKFLFNYNWTPFCKGGLLKYEPAMCKSISYSQIGSQEPLFVVLIFNSLVQRFYILSAVFKSGGGQVDEVVWSKSFLK